VCLARQLEKSGDQFALQIDGTPVVVRNVGGTLRAFRNVCAHRHSLIAREGASHSDALRCQYHGWEYAPDGRVAKVPDGRSFKGIEPASMCLDTFRVDTFAHVVFVNLAPGTATFRDDLGELASELDKFYGATELYTTAEETHEINWKIICENAVESYHVPLVHQQTFANYRDERFHEHRLRPHFTSYRDIEPWSSSWFARASQILTRVALRAPTMQRFTHTHVFPNVLLYYRDLVADMIVIEPLGPMRSRQIMHLYMPTDVRIRAIQMPLLRAYTALWSRLGAKIVAEDRAAWRGVQEGMKHSTHAGILSAREERVYHFQKWVAERLGRDVA
jgi:phenylpropionate dioxygenase-like ring-hydroxylating dioxygenase large terminal subunit